MFYVYARAVQFVYEKYFELNSIAQAKITLKIVN